MLCGEDPEDLEQFLLKFLALTLTRDPFVKKTMCLLNEYLRIREQQDFTRDHNLFIALILNSTAVDLYLSETQKDDFLSKFETVARFVMHCIVKELVF